MISDPPATKRPTSTTNIRKSNNRCGCAACNSCQSKYCKVKCHGQSTFSQPFIFCFLIRSCCPNPSPITWITLPKKLVHWYNSPFLWRDAVFLISSLPDVEGTLKKWLSVRLRVTRAFHARPVCVSRHPRPTAHAARCTSAGSDYTEWRRTPAEGDEGWGEGRGVRVGRVRHGRPARKSRHTISTESSTREKEPCLSRKARRCSPARNAQQRQSACSWTLNLLLYEYLLLWAIHGASEQLESPSVAPLYRCQLSSLKAKYLLLEKVCLLGSAVIESGKNSWRWPGSQIVFCFTVETLVVRKEVHRKSLGLNDIEEP